MPTSQELTLHTDVELGPQPVSNQVPVEVFRTVVRGRAASYVPFFPRL